MKGSIQWLATSCQLPSQRPTSRSRDTATFQRSPGRRRRSEALTSGASDGNTTTSGAVREAGGSGTADTSRCGAAGASAVSGGTAGSAGAGELDLDAKGLPHRPVQVEEVGC